MTSFWNRRRWCGAGLGLAAGSATPWLMPVAAALDEAGERAASGADAQQRRLRFGTPERPFSARSPWNSRPVDPVLGEAKVPKDDYYPTIENGTWSTGVFVCGPDDKPQRVRGLPGQPGVWDPDAEAHQSEIVIPRWPQAAMPSKGSDGHLDVVDTQTGIIHSFFMLKRIGDDDWRAQQYAWSRLDGRGWGDPAHYFQGARAAGVPTMGGVIRRHEYDDGDTMFRHALAMSLTFSALQARPNYVFPATSADNSPERNKGTIPEGALLMLPPQFDVRQLSDLKLRKVAETLKTYGAYVVDRNTGTPFVIYAEIGTPVRLHPMGGWNNQVASDLDRIRAGLRQVTSVASWVDGHGRPVDLAAPMNVLSMRGQWKSERGDARARYDTWKQAVVLSDARAGDAVSGSADRAITGVYWAKPKPGQNCRLTARAGNATLRLQLRSGGGSAAVDTGELVDGKSVTFRWPERYAGARLVVRATADGEAWAGGELLALAE
ncbi:hypothetical protein CDN99_03795 [Roseateles aquatilis]|uniref:Atrophin-1 multi-domain protein n=1 Tax=Roseateles aquatilis TaxID=431061 RepID=A0A246JM62_9BURK|nr:Atrophin-1 multi-domain protein [Roseateles aquatilis]OWQ93593.1 hypothetical protein CDN99_03795 [Roseateles aquatilis]